MFIILDVPADGTYDIDITGASGVGEPVVVGQYTTVVGLVLRARGRRRMHAV